MMSATAIADALVSSGLCQRNNLKGMRPEAIAAIERSAGGLLPAQYRAFLEAVGEGAGAFFSGTDMFGPGIAQLKEDAVALLAERGEAANLPADAFVFSMHQGYQFHYFLLSEGDDPPVYDYLEGDGFGGRVSSSLSAYLQTAIAWHLSTRNGNVG